MPSKKDTQKKNNPHLDSTIGDVSSSLIVYPNKVLKKQSLLSIIIKGRSRTKRLTSHDILKQVLTSKEEQVFKSALARQPNEDKYRVKKKISSGGMGNILYVYDKDLQRHSILKVILPKHKGNKSLIKSFIREARITGQLEHPNIIPVHDLGFLQGYGIYFTMNFIKGESLLEIIQKLEKEDREYKESYDVFNLLNIFRKICDAVSFSHSKNIIHRDIKPANIMVGHFGEVLLMDWGLAKTNRPNRKSTSTIRPKETKLIDKHSPTATRFGVVKGTPAYMPPEQAIGDTISIDQYSDIFLLGATLYHMLTLNPPYTGSDINKILYKAQKREFIPPEELLFKNHQLTTDLCRIIKKAMAFDKLDRYQDVKEMTDEIDDLVRGKMTINSQIFKKGEFLLKEGEIGNKCYIILSGDVEVFKGKGKKRMILGHLSDGDIVGEMALITNAPRTASAVATSDAEVLVSTQDMFTNNLETLPFWMEKTIAALADRLGRANEKLTRF